MSLGCHEDALRDLDRSLELDPNDAYARSRRGSAYIGFGRYEDAVRDFNRSLELEPNDAYSLRQ
jgi:Flp pilus assembly protein TadD